MIFSCNKQTNNFSNNEWGYLLEIEDGYKIKPLFHNDSINDYPLVFLNDSMIAFDYKKSQNDSLAGTIESRARDTFLYDFKYIFNRPFLLIKRNQSKSFIDIYHNTKRNALIDSTNNFFKPINFKVGGFMIGDTIYKEALVNIEEKEYQLYETKANPKNNENIILKLINNTIYGIEQRMITEDKINNIVKVISNKSELIPDTIKPSPPFYEEGFRWKNEILDITLSKKDMVQYYTDQMMAVNTKEKYAIYTVKAYGNLISEARITNDNWNLKYDHFYQRIIWRCNLIENHSNVKSSIIE